MNNIIDEYREAMRAVYGDAVADGLDVMVKDGWYHVTLQEKPEGEQNAPARYRKTQLQATIANLRSRAAQKA